MHKWYVFIMCLSLLFLFAFIIDMVFQQLKEYHLGQILKGKNKLLM